MTFSTATFSDTLQLEMDKGELSTLGNVVAETRLGTVNAMLKVTVAALGATSTVNITLAAVLAAATINVGAIPAHETLPAIGRLRSLRVTTSGTNNALGVYVLTNAGVTPLDPIHGTVVGHCALSDDGTTLTFGHTITGFIIEYFPAPHADMQTIFESQG